MQLASSVSARDLARHARPGPRYTSYPPATTFSPSFGPDQVRATLAHVREHSPDEPISLYCHIPFCSSLCWYCACNVKVTRERDRGRSYLDALIAELALVGNALGRSQPVAEVALGGGSPNFLTADQHTRLVEAIAENFDLRPGAELGIECDPRDTSRDQVDNLARLGFKRLSVGVQDFAPQVQEAIHRQQSAETTRALVDHARSRGFTSLNIDLVYGLPGQTRDSLRGTLNAVIAMTPQQVALFGYAHLPRRFRHQRLVERKHSVPGPDDRAALFLVARDTFENAGYIQVGLDHFAPPDAPLARAARDGSLWRNFQGYSVKRADNLIGFGASAISSVADAYWQNNPEIPAFAAAVTAGRAAVVRGMQLDRDDRIRRRVIATLMCHAQLDFAEIDAECGIRFEDYFDRELDGLGGPDYAELIEVDFDARRLRTTPLGTYLIRNVCMVFDRHLAGSAGRARFSPTM
ncbi:MAG: oxygen-independent coproporphyrinogen III oxidase [Proteobacteria bacterium]|nr:oxygen-independent coproporphyrinogen III oxidase [Pseudomonadota bacterium]